MKTRVQLDRMAPGEQLEVLLDLGEPSESVPASCREDGDLVLLVEPAGEGAVRMLVQSRPAELRP